jgi:hypothetical protein
LLEALEDLLKTIGNAVQKWIKEFSEESSK